MYDTVKLWFPGHNEQQDDSRLDNVRFREGTDEEIIVSAEFGNMKVEFWETGTSVRGSLAKQYFGNNVETLTRPLVKDVLADICDAINRPVKDAIVTRIDVAENYELSTDLAQVFAALGRKGVWNRSELRRQGEGFSYTTRSSPKRELLFYRKKPELKARRVDPALIARVSDNMLRIELRITSGIMKYLGADGARAEASKMYARGFYSDLVRKHREEYFSVEKRGVLSLRAAQSNLTPTKLRAELAALGLKTRGYEMQMETLKRLRLTDDLDDNRYYKLTQSLRALEKNEELFTERECVAELDRLVREKAAFHLDQ